MQSTLRAYRKQSELTCNSILERVKVMYPDLDVPKKRSGVLNWETQGFSDIRIIRALSIIYNQPFEEIERLALQAKRQFREAQEKKMTYLVTTA